MSMTAHWEPDRPASPLGSSSDIKYLVFPEGQRLKGIDIYVRRGDSTDTFLRGWLAGRGKRAGEDDGAAAVSGFLRDLDTYETLRVWIDE
jgi:hypothetical protein